MKLSIITINKNNAVGLEKTILSVICQTYINIEYFIIDGASDDNSVEIIRKYEDKITYWISEPDTGIYNAMNKGIKSATGDYCLFLNSGDWLISPNSLEKTFDIINNMEEADIYYGNCITSDFTFYTMPKQLSIESLYLQMAPNHQNTLIKRSLFYNHGFYDENFLTVSDSIFFVKEFWTYHSKFIYIETVISMYATGGISKLYKTASKELHEQMKKIMGHGAFTALVRRNKVNNIEKLLKKIIKCFLPYGLLKLYGLLKKTY
jgi:glycosyltransferase involved in cell wall biosynthesis